MTQASIQKELKTIRALAAELVKHTSRLEEGTAPFQGRSPRKGTRKLTVADKAVIRRNEFIRKKSGQ